MALVMHMIFHTTKYGLPKYVPCCSGVAAAQVLLELIFYAVYIGVYTAVHLLHVIVPCDPGNVLVFIQLFNGSDM